MSRMTPIERAIAGEPEDRKQRWYERQKAAGFKRVSLWVPEEYVELLKELKEQLVHGDRASFEALHDFLTVSYRAMLVDPSCDDDDRAYAEWRLRDLALPPAASFASEDDDARSPDDAAH